MYYHKDLIAGKLRRWEKYLKNFHLPLWEDIPDLGLYMDQVIILLTQYLDYYPPEIKEDPLITASTINNYVRMKVMPEPIKKKYYRIHIAYLIMICTLKQSLSIAMLQTMIPMGISEEEVKMLYNAYVERHQATSMYFIEQIRHAAAPILDANGDAEEATGQTNDLIAASAIASGLAKLLAEKLLLLESYTSETDIPLIKSNKKDKNKRGASN